MVQKIVSEDLINLPVAIKKEEHRCVMQPGVACYETVIYLVDTLGSDFLPGLCERQSG